MEQLKSSIFNNQNLFSNNYLLTQLPVKPIWKKFDSDLPQVFNQIKSYYNNIKDLNLGPGQEAELEDKFIRPVLKSLGWAYTVQPVTERGPSKKHPDYALFPNENLCNEALKNKNNRFRFYQNCLTILEVKYWNRRLNDTDKNDGLDSRDPSAQTILYLEDVHIHSNGNINWAILTNGKLWRLFYFRASSKASNYYEVDLENIILKNSIEDFKYFYLFFSKFAFLKETKTNLSILDFHLSGSKEYAKTVSDKLKELIFEKIFENLAQGFLNYYKENEEIKTVFGNDIEHTLDVIFHGSMTLLFRILFLLYAESRNLLPVDDKLKYYQKSFKKLKEDIINDIQAIGIENINKKTYDYYNRFLTICDIINSGNKDLNIPAYNGGLFRPSKFFKYFKISDYYFANVIKDLTVETTEDNSFKFIDYSSLGVRHLGDIYEGLLEFHLKVAETDLIEVKQKRKLIYVPLNKAKIKNGKIKKKGEVYIQSYKHGRKITGTYYTPDFIVQYLVENTLNPILQDRFNKAKKLFEKLNKLYKKQRKQLGKDENWKYWEHPGEPKGKYMDSIKSLEEEIFNTIFDIKVLDPAMGSGHFLVSAVNFISENIITFLAKFPDNPVIRKINKMKQEIIEGVKSQGITIDEEKLTEINLIKRLVMKKCIYGIDINPLAVELAKLSLWLDSFTIGAPLSFLDHHLKCGNSLIGATLQKLENSMSGSLFAISLEPLKRAINNLLLISALTDNTFDEVKQSIQLYQEVFNNIQGYRLLLDILVAHYIGVRNALDLLKMSIDKIDLSHPEKGINLKLDKKELNIIKKVKELNEELNFFHYDIEFPEVFYERTGLTGQHIQFKENAGFDVIIGNPPWERVKLQENEFFSVHKPEIALSQKASERKKLIKQLEKENPDIFKKYIKAKYKSTAVSNFVKNSGDFPDFSKGDMNYYTLFVEKGVSLLNNTGLFGMVIPSGISTDKSAREFFNRIVDNRQLISLIDFENREGHFESVHRSFKFSMIVISGRSRKTDKIKMAFYLHNIQELTEDRIIEFKPDDFKLINPNTKTAPIIKNKRDFELMKSIYKNIPILIKKDDEGKIIENPWGIKFLRMFDMTNDSEYFKTAEELRKEGFYQEENGYFRKGDEIYLPLYEGKMVQIYDSRAANIVIHPENIHRPAYQIPVAEKEKQDFKFIPTPQYFVPEKEVRKRLGEENYKWFIGYKNVCSPTNERTFISTVIPFSGVGNSLPLILSDYKDKRITLLIANLSAFVLDFIVRQKVGGQNLNYFIVEQLPVLPPEYYDKEFQGIKIGDFIKERVLKLVYTGYNLKEFAEDIGYRGEPFLWDEKERLHLQSQLDALFFILYGIEREDVDYIMETFPIIKKQDKEKYGKYLRKHLILEYYNAYKSGNFDAKVKE